MGFFKDLYLKARKTVNDIKTEKGVEKIYPSAIVFKDQPLMSRGGTYKNKFPEGIIIHFTAGWRNQKPLDAVKFANKNGHRYFLIAEKGEVIQQFDLSGYGPHAGVSTCPVTKRSTVSQYYVGIEVMCAGKLTNGKTWFGQEIPKEDQRSGVISGKYQKASGTYQKFTSEQEKSLIDLCIWLCKNGTNPDLILSHEEVSPNRKDDVGLSLSMTMDEFREMIKAELKK